MKIKLTRPAEVKGWMHARAVLRIEVSPMIRHAGLIPSITPPQYIFLESQTPMDATDAKQINDTLALITI